MGISCNVCSAEMSRPVYSSDGVSVTSVCEIRSMDTFVHYCAACQHVQTAELANLDAYYDTEYNILVADEDEDQIVVMPDGSHVYRLAHQASVLLETVPLAPGARVLDYGCAKAATMRHLLQQRPDLQVHLFDVSTMYARFWERFVESTRCATYVPPPEWVGRFDLVTAFYSLEHVASPRTYMAQVSELLAPEGLYYGIVPDWTANTADFVVVDHVNHFTVPSLHRLMREAGLEVYSIRPFVVTR